MKSLNFSRRATLLATPALLFGGWAHGSLPAQIVAVLADSNGYSGLATNGTAGYDPAIDVTNPLCLEYRNAYQNNARNFITIAKDQFNYNNAGDAGVATGGIGCGLTFMRDYFVPNRLNANSTVEIVACGIGGVASSYWMAGGAQNATAYARISQAVAADARNTLDVIIVILGTNDAITSVSGATFTSNMQTLATNFRNPANVTGASANTPILFVGLIPAWVTEHTGTAVDIDAALQALPSSISKSGYVDMTGMAGQTAIHFHLNAASQRLIGNPGLGNAWAALSP